MSKDPALLLYTKDWFTGTMEMSAADRGVYINLLVYQHINGSIPSDKYQLEKISMCGRDENFNDIWCKISNKFEKDGNRLVNQKLMQVVSERSAKAKKNRVIGIFASLIRECGLNKSEKEKIKKLFKCDEFMHFEANDISKRLTEWFDQMVNQNGNRSLGDANEDANTILKSFSYMHDINFSKDWVEYIKSRKKKATPRAQELALKELHKHPLQTAILMIQQSIQNGWEGIFPLKKQLQNQTAAEIKAQSEYTENLMLQ